MMPAARISDMHVCPQVTGVVPHVGGPVISGEPTVLIGFMPAARQTDQCTCVGPPDVIVMGSATVMIGFLPAARLGDPTIHGGTIAFGFPTVLIG
ncbi:MAG: PAAR domain-containing protein [Planctomyces sp.]|nr:PAAR domain-containing protein [Planctomyces sp.]